MDPQRWEEPALSVSCHALFVVRSDGGNCLPLLLSCLPHLSDSSGRELSVSCFTERARGPQDAPTSDPQSIEDLSIYSAFNSVFLLVPPPPRNPGFSPVPVRRPSIPVTGKPRGS